MGQKKGRSRTINFILPKELPKPPSKSKVPPSRTSERPEDLCPQDFPEIGKKFGPSAFADKPFPLCLGLSPDPHANDDHHFHDRLCLKFLSDLHYLLMDQGRVHDVARLVDGLKELTNHNSGSMTCDALKKQLKLAALKWKTDKLGPDGPSPDKTTLKRLFLLFIALYDFKGESDPIVRQLCSTT